MGFSFKNHGGSKIVWDFEKSVGCTAFWWGIGGGMEIVVGYFSVGSVGGGSPKKASLYKWEDFSWPITQ